MKGFIIVLLSMVVLYTLVNLLSYDSVIISESNIWVLWAEIVMVASALLYGIYLLAKTIWRLSR